jgi:ribose-phosphate pyrophosphokinase
MNTPLIVALPGNEGLAQPLACAVAGELAPMDIRQFPDGETYLRYQSASLADRPVVILCTLDHPDEKVLPLIFAASTARDLGAGSVGVVCPYLGYMRQDQRFEPGEAITSVHFARLLSGTFDWLITVDPHLHRRNSLSEIYSMPAVALQAAPLIANWIREQVERPLLLGPDSESEQWVANVARSAGAPYVILNKIRHGDLTVEVSIPEIERWHAHTPVLVDDIVSTARTMIETLRHLARIRSKPAVCIAVHGIFAGRAYQELREAGASRVVTANTVPHETNSLDVTNLLAGAIRDTIRTVAQPETVRGQN